MPSDTSSADVAASSGNECCSKLEQHPKAKAALAEYDADDRALFNDSVSRGHAGQVLLQREQPHHRMFVLLRAKGYTNAEIAHETGYTPEAVGYALRQPWARQRLMELLHEMGEPGIEALLKGELVPSIMKLAEVRDDDTAPASAKIAAANSIIDRYLGKPTQRVETSKAPTFESVEEAQRELERLRSEEQRLRSN